ncbi:ABC transporter substrate-binding protein [Paracraurococcus ruber]|nr:ABC transporter substrate-binding protein [Paracraurococcus ruber]
MFSGTTGRPSSGPMASARMRPTMSVTPATATGITRRSGRLGNRSCARAGAARRGRASRLRRFGMAGPFPVRWRTAARWTAKQPPRQSAGPRERRMTPITLQEPFRAVFYAPFYAALARGDYAREGVEVTLREGGIPANAKDAVLAGLADLAWGGPMRILLAHEADPASPLRNFGAVVMRDPFFLVGRGARPGFRLSELAGLRLGTVAEVPTPWWTLQHDIRLAGLDPATVSRVTDRSMAENAAAVLGGRLDVAQLFEPFVTQLEDQGGAIWHAAAGRGPTGYTTFTTTTERLQARRAEFKAMLRGLARTLAWVAESPAEALADCIAGHFPDLPPPVLVRCLARYKAVGLWTADPFYPEDAFTRLETAMFTAGAITRKPGFAATADNAIVAEALAGWQGRSR